MSTETRPGVDLEELLNDDIPCTGWAGEAGSPRRPCGKSAALMSRGHGCKPGAPRFKCIGCWQAWYAFFFAAVHEHRFVYCTGCNQPFTDPAHFSDYRPF